MTYSQLIDCCSKCKSDLVVEAEEGKLKCLECKRVSPGTVFRFIGKMPKGRWVELTANKRGEVRVKCPLCELEQWVPGERLMWMCNKKYCEHLFPTNKNLV